MTLRAAVIGLGRMGAEPSSRFDGKIPAGWLPISHAEALINTESIELVALCDNDEKRLTHFGQHYGIPKVYSDYRQMITDIKPDILSIATRTDVRCDIIRFGLEHGIKGFYAEKPISRSISDCRNILNQVDQHKAKIVYGATRRAMDVYSKAKEICWSGEIGEIEQITIEFGYAPLLWAHPHSVDLMTFFANSTSIKSIQGTCFIDENNIQSNIVDDDPLIENAYIVFENGIRATITQTRGFNIRIGCTKGILTIHGNGNSIEINRTKVMTDYFHSVEEITVTPSKSGTQHLMEDLKKSVINNMEPTHIKPAEILCGQQILFGIVQSTLEGGRKITPGMLNEDLVVTGRTGVFYA